MGTAKQHTEPRQPIFPPVKLDGKDIAGQKTVNPSHTAVSPPSSSPAIDRMTPKK